MQEPTNDILRRRGGGHGGTLLPPSWARRKHDECRDLWGRSVSEGDELGARSEERELLVGFLDWYREVVERKVQGLSTEDASKVMTATGLSPLGVVAHLATVEIGWFAETFAGEPVDPRWELHGSFRLTPDDTTGSIIDEYRRACDRSRSILERAPSLDALRGQVGYWGHVSLRWLLVHMIEETARHAGHLDIMCEAIDGRTGD